MCEVCLDIAIYTHFKVACTTKKREKLVLAACCSIFARVVRRTTPARGPRAERPCEVWSAVGAAGLSCSSVLVAILILIRLAGSPLDCGLA